MERLWRREQAMILNAVSEHLHGEDHLVGSCTDDQRDAIAQFLVASLSKSRCAQVVDELDKAQVVEGWKRLIAAARRLLPTEWVAVRERLAALKSKPTEGVPA